MTLQDIFDTAKRKLSDFGSFLQQNPTPALWVANKISPPVTSPVPEPTNLERSLPKVNDVFRESAINAIAPPLSLTNLFQNKARQASQAIFDFAQKQPSTAEKILALEKPVTQIKDFLKEPYKEVKLPEMRIESKNPILGAVTKPPELLYNYIGKLLLEGAANAPRNYIGGITRTGLDIGQMARGEDVSKKKLLADVASIAKGIMDVSFFPSAAGVAKNAAESAGTQTLASVFKQGAKSGAEFGGAYGGLQALIDNQDVKDTMHYLTNVFGGTAQGAIGGSIVGGGTSAAIYAAGKVFGTVFNYFKEQGQSEDLARENTVKYFRDKFGKFAERVGETPAELKRRLDNITVNNVYDDASGKSISMPLGEWMKKYGQAGFVDFGAEIGAKQSTQPPVNNLPSVFRKLAQRSKNNEEFMFALKSLYQSGRNIDDFAVLEEKGIKPNELFSLIKTTQKSKVPAEMPVETGKNISKSSSIEDIFSSNREIPNVQTETSRLPKTLSGNRPTSEIVPQQETKSFDDIIQQGRSQIGSISDEAKPTLKQSFNKFYTQWVDRYAPIVDASRRAKSSLEAKNAMLRPENDPEYLVRRLTGAGGIAETRFNKELKPIIDELDNLGVDKTDMDLFLKAKRDVGFGSVGREVKGSDPVLAQKQIDALRAKYGDSLDQVASKLYEYQNKGFQEMVDAGFLSPESAKLIRQQNPDYVPFDRVMDELDNYLGLPTRKTMQGSQPVKKIKGSERQVYSPIESIIANTYKQRAAIEKNNVAKSIVGLQNVAPELGFQKVGKAGDDTITVWDKGIKQYFKVGTDIAETAKGLNEENMNLLLKIFSAPASLLRQGATGRNPDFMFPNIVRDQLDAAVTSKYGYVPFIDWARGLASMMRQDDVYQRYLESGAKIDLGSLSGRKSIQEMFNAKTERKNLFDWIGKGLDVMGTISEQPTRVGLFKRAFEKTGNELLAAMESRDATVDFARMGSKMKVANSIIPFLNVGVQGFDKMIRAVKNNPAKAALNFTIYAALPQVMTTMYNLANHADEYAEIPQYEKDNNFIFVIGRNDKGTVDYVSIPKGNVVPLVANPVQSFLEFANGQSQQSFSEFATQFITSALPVVGDGSTPGEVMTKTIGQNLPQLVKPVTENLINKSFWKYDTKKEQSKEIVPYYMQKKEPYQQSYEWTPSAYKAVGAVLNVSPLQVQNFMEGYLAGYTKIPAQILDNLVAMSRGDDVSNNNKTIIRRFLKETYPNSGKKPESNETQTTPIMERITGKVSASDGSLFDGFFKKKSGKETTTYFYKDKDGASKKVDVTDVTSMPNSTTVEKIKRRKEAFKLVDDVAKLKPEEQEAAIKQLGISDNEYQYYQAAKESTEVKKAMILDNAKSLKNREEVMQMLVDGRTSVNGEQITSNAVIDALYEDGYISKNEKAKLKAIKWDEDAQKLTMDRDYKGGGTGSSSNKKLATVYKNAFSKLAEITKPSYTPIKSTNTRRLESIFSSRSSKDAGLTKIEDIIRQSEKKVRSLRK